MNGVSWTQSGHEPVETRRTGTRWMDGPVAKALFESISTDGRAPVDGSLQLEGLVPARAWGFKSPSDTI
jgi:hypothetical protein